MLVLVVFCVSLALATGVAGRLLRALARRPWRRTRRVAAAIGSGFGVTLPPEESGPEPAELLVCTLELSRLSEAVRSAHATDQPGKYLRVRATEGAYDDVLLRTCRLAGVHSCDAVRGPLTTDERFDAETALLAGGVHW